MEEEKVYKLHVKMCTRWYPKPNKPEPQNNDWQIVRAKVIKAIDSDDSLELEYGQLTLVGNMVVMEPGAVYLVYVKKGWNEKFNKIQYDIQYSQEVREFGTRQQVEDFLEMFITQRQIKALYGITDEPLKLIDEHNVEELCKAAGIGEATAERIISRYEACKDYGPAYGELGKMGITKTLIDKLIGFYNSADTVLDIIRNRPYILADDIKGIGFLKADEIALKNGFDRHDMERVKAFMIYVMNDVASNIGSTYISYTYLMDRIDEVIGRDTPQDTIDDALDFLIDNKIIWCNDRVFEDGTVETTLALKRYYDIEKKLAYHIRRLVDAPSNIALSDKEINEKIKNQEKRQGWCYTDTQKYGVKVIADNNVVIIRGYGGTGKSSTVAGLLSCLDDEYHFEQCALSGKASVNLTDITGIEGKTIHRLLKYNPSQGFTYCEEEPLDTNMIILDEGSMVDISLALSLFQAIPTGAKLVILGDTNQLPPIGAGNLLQDMIDSEIIPVVTFDKIHRQGAKSGIIPFSIEVANGVTHYKQSWEGEEVLGELQDLKMIGFKCARDDEKPSVDLIMKEYKEMYQECKDASQITVVLPTNTRGTCTKVVNKLIQDYVLPRRTRGDFIEIGIGKEKCNVYRGDRILVLKNNYDLDIFNGNVGEVLAINKEDNSLIADFGRGEVEIKGTALNELDLGYAISTHKSQGSTLPYLIYCIDNTHYVMLNRQQVYTGITRAKKKATFIFETKALNSAIRTSKIKYVNTFLYHFLVGDLK